MGVSVFPQARVVQLLCDGAQVDGVPLGAVSVDVRWLVSGRVVTLRATGPLAESFEAVAEPNGVRVSARALDLGVVSKLAPVLALDGKADLDAVLSTTQPATLRIDASDVRWRGEPVGTFHLLTRHEAGALELAARWGEPETPHATLQARIPLALQADPFDVTWLDEEKLSIRLDAPALTPAVLRPLWKAHPAADFEAKLSLHV